MVCKENVVSWFGNLSSYKRIDVMCTLLNMCLPFEVRYLGACIEDLGKRDYTTLRETENRANTPADLTDLSNSDLIDKHTRRKLALYMALLHTCNHACAVIMYKNLSNFDPDEMLTKMLNGTNFSRDYQPLEELLLIYTMALNHPAFNYQQKSTIADIFLKLREEETRLGVNKNGPVSYKTVQGCVPCVNQNESELVVTHPPIQTIQVLHEFPEEMHMRNSALMPGMPPQAALMHQHPGGMAVLPVQPEQMSSMPPQAAGQPHYLPVGYATMAPMAPWPMMQHNQIVYQAAPAAVAAGGEMVAPPPTPTAYSPLVSQQSSPTHSQTHSRSNSPTVALQQRNKVNGPPAPSSTSSSSAQMTHAAPAASSTSTSQQQLQPRTSAQPTSNTVTISTSSSSSNVQTNITNSSAMGTTTSSVPVLPSMSSNRAPQLPPLMPSRPLVPYNGRYSGEHIAAAPTAATSATTPTTMGPPLGAKAQQPRLKPALASETGNKEMPNFKGNFQNYSKNEIRRLSNEDVSSADGVTFNGPIAKSQTNGVIGQLADSSSNKNFDGPNSVVSSSHATSGADANESETMPVESGEALNGGKTVAAAAAAAAAATIAAAADPASMHNYHPQNQTPNSMPAGMRRYANHMEPAQIQMFHATPTTLYPAHNACYNCFTTVPIGVPNRYTNRSGAQQHFYCLAQLQGLRLEDNSNRVDKNKYHSPTTESPNSHSPPVTPPATNWQENNIQSGNVDLSLQQQQQQQQTVHSIPSNQQQQQAPPPPPSGVDRGRASVPRKNQSHMIARHKTSTTSSGGGGGAPPPPPPAQMMNGVASGQQSGGGGAPPPSNAPNAAPMPPPQYVTGPPPPGGGPGAPSPTPMSPAYLAHTGHFTTLRPTTTGIYTNFTHAYARPAPGYPTLAYQHNGEMLYHFPPPGTIPPGSHPATNAQQPSQQTNVQQTSSGQQQPPPQQQQQQPHIFVPAVPVTYAPVNSAPPTIMQQQQQQQQRKEPISPTPMSQPVRISCYNCGSNAHLAQDCTEVTMDTLTKQASYKLDYSSGKPKSSNEKNQSSDK